MHSFPTQRTSVLLLTSTTLLAIACSRVDGSSTNTMPDSSAAGGSTGGGSSGAETGGTASGGAPTTPSTGGVLFTHPSTGGTSPEPPALPHPLMELCDGAVPGGGGQGGLGGMGGASSVPSVGSADGSLVIDDFEDGDDRVLGNGRSGRWESHNDATGGVQSPLGGRHAPESNWVEAVGENETFGPGRASSRSVHFTGSGFTGWGSGQAIYFAENADGKNCLYDASAFSGITFWARGKVELTNPDDKKEQPQQHEHNKMRVHVVERDVVPNADGGECDERYKDCWDSHRTRIELEDCWQMYVLPFSELRRDGWSKLDPGELTLSELYQLVFEVSGDQDYEVWIDDIEFFVGDAPEPVTCGE